MVSGDYFCLGRPEGPKAFAPSQQTSMNAGASSAVLGFLLGSIIFHQLPVPHPQHRWMRHRCEGESTGAGSPQGFSGVCVGCAGGFRLEVRLLVCLSG